MSFETFCRIVIPESSPMISEQCEILQSLRQESLDLNSPVANPVKINMISLQNISVNFFHQGQTLAAVKNVSLDIPQGEVYGIVGTSGAGKSTVLRTINLLQKPTAGRVLIGATDITDLPGEELRKIRLKIGMVFQHFNLILNKTVAENVAFVMKIAGKSRQDIAQRVPELLDLVGLSDKETVYPSRLSGGQKQRVGIARAIANEPQILLCDEPTSALDLETTGAILDLLKTINQRLHITTVLISHEMAVIKKICRQVAVMNQGEVVETGDVYEIFAVPQHPVTAQLAAHTHDLDLPERLLKNARGALIKVLYRGGKAEEPVLSDTIRRFDIALNVLHGKIEYINDRPLGLLILEAVGAETEIARALSYLQGRVAQAEIIYGQ
jgi:D-methionine transport system ATP-binding protein